jgi:hypothetical protein
MRRISLIPMLLSSILPSPARASDATDGRLREELGQLSRRRVLFGHQSVGAGIVAGLTRLSVRAGVKLDIVELTSPTPTANGAFVHALVDRNGDPRRKLASFERLMAHAAGAPPEFALFKFCYVDFDAGTDVSTLFEAYQTTFRTLQREYPRTTFIHVTVPLTTVPGGLKSAIKRLLNRPPAGFLENSQREEFNRALREAYRGGGLFDLARLEATSPSGTTTTAEWRGRSVLALDPSSTTDGGHPDPVAEERIARALVALLAALP